MRALRTRTARGVNLPHRGTVRRALVVVAVLAGLFAMHGLTTAHDPSMASVSSDAPTAHTMADMMPTHTMGAAATQIMNVAVTATLASAAEDMGSMGAMCVALLTGLLMLLAVRQFVLRVDAAELGSERAAAIRWRAKSFGPAPPDLAVLSVLRT